MSTLQRRLLKTCIFLLCLLPLVWLAYALLNDQLGANPIEVVTRSLGEWGLQLLIVTLCMTPLKDLLKQPWPIQIRRMLGLFCFFYLVLHLSSYLWLDQFFDWVEIWTDIKKRPFITVGMLSMLGLIPLALTSNKWSQRKLGRSWRRLHFLIYPVSILAVLHFFWLVKFDQLRPVIFAACLAMLLGYRWLKASTSARA